MSNTRNTKSPSAVVTSKIRDYEPMIVAEAEVTGEPARGDHQGLSHHRRLHLRQ
jgi:hypothetical protein